MDIQVDARFVPPELGAGWWGPYQMPWQPFWWDDEGIHVAWHPSGPPEQAPRLVVSSFDERGAFLRAADYPVFPEGVTTLYSGPYSAAGGPDGAFAIGYGYRYGDPAEFSDEVLLGNTRDPAVRNVWRVPLGPSEGTRIPYIAWDTEAFSVLYPLGAMQISRLLPDGTELQGRTQVGMLRTIDEYGVDLTTGTESGITYATSLSWEGIWLTGHERDGTLLPGMEASGGLLIRPQGVPDSTSEYHPALALGPTGLLLAWRCWANGADENTCIQELDAAFQPVADALVLPPQRLENGRAISTRGHAMIRTGDRWLLLKVAGDSVDILETDGRSILSRTALLTYRTAPECAPEVWRQPLDLRALHVIERGGEVWFGFWDLSAALSVDLPRPYRVLRVGDGCTYRSMCDIHHAP